MPGALIRKYSSTSGDVRWFTKSRALVEIRHNDMGRVGPLAATYPLEDIADAYRYMETQQKTGIVVIDLAPGPSKPYALQPS